VEHRAQPKRALEVAPAAFDGEELLVGGGEIIRGECRVGGAQQPLAVQVRLPLGGAVVDPQQPGGGAAQVAAQPGLGAQRSDEFVAAPRGPVIGANDQRLQVRDEVGADLLVALGLFGVVALPAGSGDVSAGGPSFGLGRPQSNMGFGVSLRGFRLVGVILGVSCRRFRSDSGCG
jgi:hypothetical protein